jgi:hypothetical protein
MGWFSRAFIIVGSHFASGTRIVSLLKAENGENVYTRCMRKKDALRPSPPDASFA